jgi:aspartate/methionine/tyrosine aminotransferase
VGYDLDQGLTHYPPNNGWPRLREAISEHMASSGLRFDADEIIVTSGATEALFSTLTTLLNPGDEAIVPMPAFLLYESVVTLARAHVVGLDTHAEDFQISRESLAPLVSERTKAIVLTSPNNPTGVCLSAASLDAVAELARERGFYVVCDDVYDQLVFDEGFERFATRHPELRAQTIVVNSFSKPYAMTGWRLGWLAAPAALSQQIAKVHQYAVSSVVSFTQGAAIAALHSDVAPLRASYERQRDLVLRELEAMGLPCVRPAGAFYAFPQIRELGLSSEDFCVRAIEEAGVALVPGSIFGAEGYVRLSYACDEETLRCGLRRLAQFVSSLGA